MSNPNFELVNLKYESSQLFLVWKSCEDDPDQYLTVPGSGELFVSRDEAEIRKIASTLGGGLVLSENLTEFDLKRFWRSLEQLRPSRRISIAGCSLILDTWNLFEDIARSTNLPVKMISIEGQRIDQKIYEKFFYGNNLPSVTPNGEIYSPKFSSEELKVIRYWFRSVWTEITASNPALMAVAP